MQVGPSVISPSPTRGTYASSINVVLPAAWLLGNVALSVSLDSANAVNETNEANNAASIATAFTSIAPLDVMIVPVQYTHTPNGQVYPAPTVDTIGAVISKLYPVSAVNVSWHAPVGFTGDLRGSSAWSTLLNQVTTLRQSEVGSNSRRLYYALVPIQNASGRWFSSGIAGIGWLGGNRASVGLDLSGTSAGFIAAHEIGHNLGRSHAPCGNPSGVDPNYPYANASISQFGLDIVTYRVWSPTAPDNAKDMMSYCSPQWISDYTYTALFNVLRNNVQVMSASAPQPGVLVRFDLPDSATPIVQPSYALSNVTMDETSSSDYAVQIVDVAGNVVLSQPVVVLETSAHTRYRRTRTGQFQNTSAEQDVVLPPPMIRSIQALIPQPAQRIARIQLVHGGVVVADRVWVELPVGQPAVIANSAPDASGLLRWGNVGRPALVRMTTDDGATWTTLGIDIAAGELQLDVTTLPQGNPRFEVILSDALP